MTTGTSLFPLSTHASPEEILRQFVSLFAGRGWLNQGVRIVLGEVRYRVFCSEKEFIAQRINDHCSISWGFPCWAVCIVTPDRIVEDSHLSGLASVEPGVQDWLRCLSEGDFQIL